MVDSEVTAEVRKLGTLPSNRPRNARRVQSDASDREVRTSVKFGDVGLQIIAKRSSKYLRMLDSDRCERKGPASVSRSSQCVPPLFFGVDEGMNEMSPGFRVD